MPYKIHVLEEASPSASSVENQHRSSDRLRRRASLGGYPCNYTRSAPHILSFIWKFWSFSFKAKYARLRTLYGLGCPPHTNSHSGGSGALRTTRPTVSSVEKPTVIDTTIGISFQSVVFLPFIFRLSIEVILTLYALEYTRLNFSISAMSPE